MSGPHQTLGPIAQTDDERIANCLTAIAHETGDLADMARWALRSLQGARAAFAAVLEVADGGNPNADELRDVVADGLELASDD